MKPSEDPEINYETVEDLEELAKRSKRLKEWFNLLKKVSIFPIISLLSLEASLIFLSRHIFNFSANTAFFIIIVFSLLDLICLFLLFKISNKRPESLFSSISVLPYLRKSFLYKSLSEFAYDMEQRLQKKTNISLAFKKAGELSLNKALQNAGKGLSKDATEGKSIGYYFHAYLCFTDDFGQLYRKGEKENELEENFNYLGRKYDDLADESLAQVCFIYGILFSALCFFCLTIDFLLIL